MKRKFLTMFAVAAGLFMASCSNDGLEAIQSGDEAQVTFALGLDNGVHTKAISDGLSTNKLIYAVYDASGELIKTIAGADEVNGQLVKNDAFSGGLNENVNITLAKGQQYTVAFWAQNANCQAYTTADLKSVKVSYAGLNNDETRDAFFSATTFTVAGNSTFNVTLKRPFVQLNAGVTQADWDAAVASGVTIAKSKVKVGGVADALNVLDGSVTGDVQVEYTENTIPTEKLSVDGNGDGEKDSYKYLSMSYILAPAEKAVVSDVEFEFVPETGASIILNQGLNNVPVQRNWRTNILGKLLNGQMDFTIVINPNYDGEFNDFERLEELLAQGGNVVLDKDVTFSAEKSLVIPRGVKVNLNLNGHQLVNKVAGGGALVNEGDLTIEGGVINNGDISKQGSHAILNQGGTLILNNVEAGSATNRGNAVYSVGGKVTINGGKFISIDRVANPDAWAYVFSAVDGAVMEINNASVNQEDTDITPNGIFAAVNGSSITVNGGYYKKPGKGTSYYMVYMNEGNNTVSFTSGTFIWGVGDTYDPVYKSDSDKLFINSAVVREGHDGWKNYKSDGSVEKVASVQELISVMQKLQNNTEELVNIELAANIDLSSTKWDAYEAKTPFILDGKGYTISGLTANSVKNDGFDNVGMFCSTYKAAVFKNLIVEGAKITGSGVDNCHGAVLVATPRGVLKVNHVTVKNAIISNCDRSSVLVAYLYFNNAEIANTHIEGCTVNSIGTAGAFLGMANNHNLKVSDSEVHNTTISSSEGGSKAGIYLGTKLKSEKHEFINCTHTNSKAINDDVESQILIGREV